MTRREVLQGVGALLGGVLSSSLATAVLSCGPRRPTLGDWTPRTMTPDQAELVATIAEVIVPTTDTPGARAAGVHEWVDLLLTDWLDDEDRDGFLAGLAAFESDCQASHGRSFVRLSPEKQLAHLEPLDAEAAAAAETAAAAGLPEVEDPPFFLTMKEWTLAGYYTSEIGMSQELHHLRAAGLYNGCMPFSEVGKAWA